MMEQSIMEWSTPLLTKNQSLDPSIPCHRLRSTRDWYAITLASNGSVQCLIDISFLWQLEAIVQEGGNDGSITDIDALNVRIDNQVCCTSLSWMHNLFFCV
jgi:hypothetical protein